MRHLGYDTDRRSAPSRCSTFPAGERNLIGLARVSTDAQDVQLQQDALTYGRVQPDLRRENHRPQSRRERPGLAAALDYLRPGDTLVVWKLDRLGRSVKEVLTIADDLHARGIGVRILTGKLSGSYSPPARANSSSP